MRMEPVGGWGGQHKDPGFQMTDACMSKHSLANTAKSAATRQRPPPPPPHPHPAQSASASTTEYQVVNIYIRLMQKTSIFDDFPFDGRAPT